MRRVFAAVALATAVALPAQAQQPPAAGGAQTADTVRQAARTDRRGLVERNMQLTPEEAKKFWPIYDAYQSELDKIIQKQTRAFLDFINGESSMNDANARRIARELIAADGEEQKLRERTAKKVGAALPAKKAVRFLQIENKIRTLQRYDIAEQMKLVQ